MSVPMQTHVLHLVYRFSSGGLENVVAQIINGLPPERFRHTLVALTDIDDRFATRLLAPGVRQIALHKPPGPPFRTWPAFYRLLRHERPDVMHSCNLAALDFVPVAALAGVRRRIHAEHGWDVTDQGGANPRNRRNRKLWAPFVNEFVAVSEEVRNYLRDDIGVAPTKLRLITNGVDTEVFRPIEATAPQPDGMPFAHAHDLIVGTVGRLDPVKDQRRLIEAFASLQARGEPRLARARLMLVGDGPLRAELEALVHALGIADRTWFAGERHDVPELLRQMHVFVLCSLAEGTSCALQEAIATGLTVVATDVGGNAAVLAHGQAGLVVPRADTQVLAEAIHEALAIADEPARRTAQSALARGHALATYSIARMLRAYAGSFGSVRAQEQVRR